MNLRRPGTRKWSFTGSIKCRKHAQVTNKQRNGIFLALELLAALTEQIACTHYIDRSNAIKNLVVFEKHFNCTDYFRFRAIEMLLHCCIERVQEICYQFDNILQLSRTFASTLETACDILWLFAATKIIHRTRILLVRTCQRMRERKARYVFLQFKMLATSKSRIE